MNDASAPTASDPVGERIADEATGRTQGSAVPCGLPAEAARVRGFAALVQRRRQPYVHDLDPIIAADKGARLLDEAVAPDPRGIGLFPGIRGVDAADEPHVGRGPGIICYLLLGAEQPPVRPLIDGAARSTVQVENLRMPGQPDGMFALEII